MGTQCMERCTTGEQRLLSIATAPPAIVLEIFASITFGAKIFMTTLCVGSLGCSNFPSMGKSITGLMDHAETLCQTHRHIWCLTMKWALATKILQPGLVTQRRQRFRRRCWSTTFAYGRGR